MDNRIAAAQEAVQQQEKHEAAREAIDINKSRVATAWEAWASQRKAKRIAAAVAAPVADDQNYRYH